MARPHGIRVIAGSARGRRLVVPAGDDVRPTKDSVREAVFSALGARGRLVGASVLDCFAGSGALAIEALSRGAASAVLVERSAAAVAASTTNVEALGLAARARVVRGAARAVVTGPPPKEAPFDLVFVDPPYATTDEEVSAFLVSLIGSGVLDADALVVVERPARAAVVAPEGSEVVWQRVFGDTLVAFLGTT
jgi:16S rRNA (guanine966-N2)-methyltransferase